MDLEETGVLALPGAELVLPGLEDLRQSFIGTDHPKRMILPSFASGLPCGMRSARMLSPGTAHYHVMSRVVEGRYIFDGLEKYEFRRIMRGLEHLMGLRVVTYCIMSNHFHILLEVPDEESLTPSEEISDGQLVELMRPLYGDEAADLLALELKNCDEWGFTDKKLSLIHI